jgi:hypothetical protein
MIDLSIVNTNKTMFWSLPGTNLNLNFENPGPVMVDVSALSRNNQVIIWNALYTKVLKTTNANELRSLIFPAPVEVKPVPQVVVPVTPTVDTTTSAWHYSESTRLLEERLAKIEDEKEKKKRAEARKFLNQKLGIMKKLLPTKSVEDLTITLEEENFGKKRKSITSVIEGLIKSAEEKETKKLLTLECKKDLPSLYRDNISEVEVSEEEEIEILLKPED